ncbi:CPBP family intramembrane glutamic endopeptidase [Streptomyces sp. OR43]|uniref:CPBP family intramembrane glutamic endopeptidase n=1 Tax=Streptomyces sp. or43 TaxID=2478957 RepID=UPI0011CDE951|nr:CPBP family intramembrane glutamic endopeptidase [Streptomyces sp. or43]TXS35696.1 CPBP family intramembrane metalloprotease [Streptomyces sp. or43]
MPDVAVSARRGRELTWPWFLVVVVAYLAVLKGTGAAIGIDTSGSESQFPTTESVIRNGLVPIAVSVLFGAAVVTWLGWWREVLHYRAPARTWVWFVPLSMLAAALLGMNYPNLTAQKASLVLSLLAMTACVGIAEELMFRGIGVQVFKRAGLTEGKVALYSSLVFGLVHLSNAFGDGSRVVLQAVVVSTSGYFFYLCLRVGGSLLLPMAVHGLWDFGLLSNSVGTDPRTSAGMVLPIVLQVVLIVLLIIKRRSVDPAPAVPTAALPDARPS